MKSSSSSTFLALGSKFLKFKISFEISACLETFSLSFAPHPQRLATSGLDVYAHNIETVRRLQPYVRDKRAGYDQSLSVLERAKVAGKKAGVYTKTSLMLGLGETEEEIVEVSFGGVDGQVVVASLLCWFGRCVSSFWLSSSAPLFF